MRRSFHARTRTKHHRSLRRITTENSGVWFVWLAAVKRVNRRKSCPQPLSLSHLMVDTTTTDGLVEAMARTYVNTGRYSSQVITAKEVSRVMVDDVLFAQMTRRIKALTAEKIESLTDR